MRAKTVVPRRARREFSAEFKAEAVRMVTERRAAGETLTSIGRALDVRPDPLRAWAREASGASEHPAAETLEQENRRLRRELATLRQEQAFVTKVAAYFAKESR